MLEKSLKSIQSQTYENYEVIILDNSSLADAQEVIGAYVSQEPRARVLRSEERLHMFANFSRGIEAAQGKYLTYFHDDDIYLPEYLEQHVSLLEAYARVGFSGSNCLVIDDSGETIHKRELIRKNDVWLGRRYIATLMRLGVNLIPMQGVVFRTCALRPSPFDSSLEVNFSDFVILMRIAEQHDVGLLATSLLKMRDHKGQTSLSITRREAIKLRYHILREYCSEFAHRWPEEEGFVRKLHRYVNTSRQRGLFWGWISSRNEPEAMACLADLNQSSTERLIRNILMQIDRLGLSFARRQKILLSPLRKIGYALGRGGWI